MSSGIEPHSITVMNWAEMRNSVLDLMLPYGDAGRECIDNRPFILVEPDIYDPKYSYDDKTGDMSALGLVRYRSDLAKHDDRDVRYKKDKNLLLTFILMVLSHESVAAIESYSEYLSMKSLTQTLEVFRLVDKSHLKGLSGRFRQAQLNQLIQFNQGTLSQAKYQQQFRQLAKGFEASFASEDAAHLGYVKVDDLLKAFFLNGLSSYYTSPMDSYQTGVGSGVKTTLQGMMQTMLAYALEKGGEVTGSSESFVPAALGAVSLSSPLGKSRFPTPLEAAAALAIRKASLGAMTSDDCPPCFNKGFRNKIGGKCGYTGVTGSGCKFNKFQTISTFKSKGKALVSSADVASSVLPSSPGVLTSANAMVTKYEADYAAYASALQLQKSVRDAETEFTGKFTANIAVVNNPVLVGLISGHLSDDSDDDQPFLVDDVDDDSDDDSDDESPVSLAFPVPSALAAATKRGDFYWDSACTHHITSNFENLACLRKLNAKLYIGGIGSSVYATHVGRLSFLPAELSVCYYVPGASHNLISLGDIQANGGSYYTTGLTCLSVHGVQGELLDEAVRNRSNLYPVGISELATSVASACPAVAQVRRLSHLTALQREECDRAEALHQGQAAHISDDHLCTDIANGLFRGHDVTPAAVRMNRKYRGACPQCVEGKAKQKSFGPSDSPALTEPGECLYGDIKALTEVSVGGKSTSVRFIDGYSGFTSETLCSSKSGKDLFSSIMSMVHTIYNANGITVKQVVVDSDPAFKPVIAMLGAQGIMMTLVGPGQFCQRAERSIQDQDNRGAAILAGLPYVLPPKYLPYLRQYVIDCLNSMSNSKTFPTSPHRLLFGRDIPATSFAFGDTVMVRQFVQKRSALAKVQGTIPGSLPRAEVGVMMGFAANLPGYLLFLLANGEIVPRSGITRVQTLPVVNGRPFLAKSVIRAHLSLPVIDDSVQFGSFPSVYHYRSLFRVPCPFLQNRL